MIGVGLTVGLVGCGNWGRHILRDLRALGCDVAVVAPSAHSRETARSGGASLVVDGVGELPPVAGVIVASPSATHAGVIESLLPLGVPVFTEKPLTADRASAERLAAAAPERLFVMDKWRYHPGVEMLAEIARTEELGPVRGLRTTRAQWGNPHSDVDGVWVLAPHDLSIALEIFGRVPEARAAQAETTAGGAAVGLTGLLGDDPWLVVEISVRHPEHRREVRLHCRDGVAVLDDGYAEHVRVTRGSDGSGKPETELRAVSAELPLLRELRAFIAHLGGGPPPRSSAAEGALVVRRIAELRALAGLNER